MCGIWGVFPNDTKGFFQIDIPAIENSMILTSLRGSHSTGIALVAEAKAKPKVIKTLGGPAYLINSDAWEKIMKFGTQSAKLMFGHGRFATKGAVTVKNAHPFTHEHITLVHNGTINYGLKDEHTEAETEVDSHALAVAIANKGLVPALEKIFGAYALIIHDAKEGCVYIVRNDDRPLHRLVCYDKHIILSEANALYYLASKMNISNPKVEVFTKHRIYKYDIATAEWTADDSLIKAMEKKYTPTTQAPWTGVTGSGGQKKWGSPGHKTGVTESCVYTDIDMLCTKVEEVPGTKQYQYELHDDNGYSYYAMSAYNYKEREGQMAKCKKHMKITDYKTGEISRFVKFRELEWFDDAKPEQVETKKGEPSDPLHNVVALTPTENVVTYNHQIIKKSKWLSLVSKNDCALCQGPILHDEVENTIVTSSGTLICGDCIKEGKHYQFGFGQ